MAISITDFARINDAAISMNEFSLKWRFTDSKYYELPKEHLDQLKPLSLEGAKFLNNHIGQLHNEVPFTAKFFRVVDQIDIADESEARKWLYGRGLPFEKNVFLTWNAKTAMIAPWKLVVKYYNEFYYPGSDDLTVFDQGLSWALLFYHEDEIYFGANHDFTI